MKNKRQIAFNKQYTLFFILGVFLLILSVTSFCEGDTGFGIGLGLVSALFLVGAPIFLPCFYLYDKEGVTLVYLYLPNERYLWKNVYEIRVIDDDTHSNRKSLLFFLVYKITGDVEGKQRFYMDGHIQKSFRNKRLIQKYWDGTITGYFDDEIEECKAWRKRHKDKKQKQIKQQFTDEILPMERSVRSEIRQALKHEICCAQNLGLTLCIEYYYVTDDLTKHNSRPNAAYTYTVLATLTPQNASEKKHTIRTEAELVRVDLCKKGYQGTVDQTAIMHFQASLYDILNKIQTQGLDSLIKP